MLKRIILILFILTLLASYPISYGAEKQESIELPIVMYHHIYPNKKNLGKYITTPEQLEKDLQYLKKNGYETISTQQLYEWFNGKGSLPEKPVMITFDDGYESTVTYAYQLLEKYQMHGIVAIIGSVTTKYTEKPDHCLQYSHMDWEEVNALNTDTVLEVQCHSNDMHKLYPRKGCNKMAGEENTAYEKALSEDLDGFQKIFFEKTGSKTDVLALPFGLYCKETVSVAEKAGFKIVFTCAEKVNIISKENADKIQVLGRYNRPNGSSSEKFFSRWIKK